MKKLITICIVLFSFLFTTSAYSQMQCGPAKIIVPNLEKLYGETLFWSGLMDDGNIFKIYTNKKTKNFTLIVIFSHDPEVECFFNYGFGFKVEDKKNKKNTGIEIPIRY